MKLEFIKYDPTQNMTVLVKTRFDRSEYAHIAGRLMSYDNVSCEQVGFIEDDMLYMAGGEFCGNASRCYAAYMHREKGMSEFDIRVSGANETIHCIVSGSEPKYSVRVDMPADISFRTVNGLTAVEMGGIAHVIKYSDYPDAENDIKTELIRLAPKVDCGAVGLLVCTPDHSYLLPTVYVKDVDSIVTERGCGSGSAALAAVAALKNGRSSLSIRQHGGVINAGASCDGKKITSLWIEGEVHTVSEGTAYI